MTPDKYVFFIQACKRLPLKADLESSDEMYFDFYVVYPSIRCPLAVNISLLAKFICSDASLIFVWANNLSDKLICSDLRYLNFQSKEIAFDEHLRRLTLFHRLRRLKRFLRLQKVPQSPNILIKAGARTRTSRKNCAGACSGARGDCCRLIVSNRTSAAAILYTKTAPVVNAVLGSNLRPYSTSGAPGNKVAFARATAERIVVFSILVVDDCEFFGRRAASARAAS